MQILHTPTQAAQWLRERVRGELRTDSRSVAAGDGFIAWPGAAVDARAFVGQALERGATACLMEAAGADSHTTLDTDAVALYAGLKADCGPVADAYYGQPSRVLDVWAVTGTNGKTSSTWWLAQACNALHGGAEPACGVIGTLGVGVPHPGAAGLDGLEATGLTTPDPVRLQRELRRFADAGLRACAIEASSIGLAERRLDGVHLHTAMLTNVTQDHLDYHGDMGSYWKAKEALFDWPGLRAAVVNVDDAHGEVLVSRLNAGQLDVWPVGTGKSARLRATDIRVDGARLRLTVSEGSQRCELHTPTVGHYNVLNVLGVLGCLRANGASLGDAALACAALSAVPGRMQSLTEPGQPLVVIDYAHTPDALDQVLQALRPVARGRGGRLWCVFGCGGDRDVRKRPMMGAVAERHADVVLITSDNPRSERPQVIISQILLGLSHEAAAHVQADRALAIAQAVHGAQDQDVVLLAGKGHECTQEIAGAKLPFSDMEQADAALKARGRRP